MPKKMSDKKKADMHKDLKGFEIKVNEFGEITGNLHISDLNAFLDGKVDDKKLKKEDSGNDSVE